MSPVWIIFWTAVAALVFAVLWRYIAGLARLRSGLRRVADDRLDLPLMPDLPRGLHATGQDLKTIAARLRDLERAATQERFGLTAILASIAEGVFIVDRQMKIRLGNPGLERMFGLAGSPVGRTVMETFRNLDLQRLVEESLREGRTCRGETVLEQGPKPRTFEVSVSPLPLDGGEAVAVAVVHDISRIKSLERVRREFVGNVSHELRTPLTIINGYLETLLEGGLEDRAMAGNALAVMHRHGNRLKHLVEDLLVISQAESRSVPLDLQTVDLPELIRRVVGQFDEPIRAQSAEVRITADGRDLGLPADPLRLEQVFLNLLENALKYGKRPGLVVDFHIGRSGRGIEVQVRDNGPGIPFEDQEHIFERFYRVDKHRSRETGGTGLGLSIVKNLVEAHGGEVSLQSVPGSGSTFRVLLPAAPDSAEHRPEAG